MHELTIVHEGRRVVLQPGQIGKVGRSEESVAVVMDPRVSREHLRLSWGPQGWLVESVGRSGSFVFGQLISHLYVSEPVEVRLASPEGPIVRLEPDGAAPGAHVAAGIASAHQGSSGAAPPAAGAVVPPQGPGKPPVSGRDIMHALPILLPIRAWLKAPELRQWYRLLVAVYALVPLVLEVVLRNDQDLKTLGWAYSLYIAPLWAMVFWYLIRPGRVTRTPAVVGAIVVGAELVLIPVLTIPWETALGPAVTSHNLLSWIIGVGLAEEITKDLPVLLLAYGLLQVRGVKLEPRMWMFVASLSGLMFGIYEASTNYVPQAIVAINHGYAIGFLELTERIFVDGFQHALWAGMAGFFIGLGTNYHRQRVPLWLFAIAVPSVLHGLNDWSGSGVFGDDQWVWIAIQAFSLFLFLGYSATAATIEREVRHTPLFRGESLYLDPPSQPEPPPSGMGS